MADTELVAELTKAVGSRQEALWIVEAAERRNPSPSSAQIAAREMAARRVDGEPLQYVLGSWQFRNLEVIVDTRALIPRPETEQVVQAVLDRWREAQPGKDGLVIVDLGCGSGVIGLSLQDELASEANIESVILTDRSYDALNLALENVVHLEAPRVSVTAGSWFDALDPTFKGAIDLLVSNPPYVAVRDRRTLADELFFEPEQALFAMDSSDGIPGFADVTYLIKNARPWLRSGGIFGIEMAEIHVEAATALALDVGFIDVAPIFDLAGKPRGVIATAP